jgi:hypothetical protein
MRPLSLSFSNIYIAFLIVVECLQITGIHYYQNLYPTVLSLYLSIYNPPASHMMTHCRYGHNLLDKSRM